MQHNLCSSGRKTTVEGIGIAFTLQKEYAKRNNFNELGNVKKDLPVNVGEQRSVHHMKSKFISLKFWETALATAVVLYIVDYLFFFSASYITIPIAFLVGIVACVFAMHEKAYLHALVCVLGICLPIVLFWVTPR